MEKTKFGLSTALLANMLLQSWPGPNYKTVQEKPTDILTRMATMTKVSQ